MPFELSRALRPSTYVLALSSVLAACGGGSTEDAATATSTTATAQAIRVPVIVKTPTIPAAPVIPVVAANSGRSGVGLNLSGISYYSSEIPTIDLMKRADSWVTGCVPGQDALCSGFASGASSRDTGEESKIDLDSSGWVRSLPLAGDTSVKFREVSTTVDIGALPTGKYIVRWDGVGSLTYQLGAAKLAAESSSGRDVVQVTLGSGPFVLTIQSTDPSNYVRNIRVYPPGGACSGDYTTFVADSTACTSSKGAFVLFESFPASSQWSPTFIQDVKKFRVLRFMDWMVANTSPVANWSDRSGATARTWVNADGVPIESMVDLANGTSTDPWMNLPLHATDDYVHQFGRLVHQRLASSRVLYLEYSNETWNYSFPAASWIYNQAQAAWPTAVTSGVSPWALQQDWYGKRLAQVCDIVKSEFGADASRVKCVANLQAGSVGEDVLACPVAAASLGKICAKSIDALAIAPYFGGYLGDPRYRATVASWYGSADGGLGKLFSELTGLDASGNPVVAPLSSVGGGAPSGAIAQTQGWMVASKSLADKYGLPMYAYEGGQGLTVPVGDKDTSFLNLEIAANRDSRMGAAYTQQANDWKAAGGQLFVYYSHIGLPSQFGMWGLKETYGDNANPKWLAVSKMRDDAGCWWAGC